MLKEMIELQKNAVAQLKSVIGTERKSTYTFRAPTGSGKTYMMADFMNQMLEENPKMVFLVSSLSKSDLAKQNYDKFCEYRDKHGFRYIDPYLINSEISGEERLHIPAEHNVYLLPRDLYKENSRLMQGPMLAFLTELQMVQHKVIVWLKDECHIATRNLDALAPQYFSATINFSATPRLSRGQHPDVEITDEQAERCKLIKRVEWGDETETVRDAIAKFKEIKSAYINLLNVNPCLIIQISNKNKADEELHNEIMPALNENPELKWMLIVGDPKECDTNDVFKAKKMRVDTWKDYAKGNLQPIDVIIFKLVISEGWDIPRACMLYQTRNSRSKVLDEQVVGRIRRNPRLSDYETLSNEAQKLAMTAWVWGVQPEQANKVYGVRLRDDQEEIVANIKVKTTKLKALSEKEDFDISDFLSKKKESHTHADIFTLYKALKNADSTVRDMIYTYADSYKKWWQATEHVDEIAKESERYLCDYEQSMTLDSEESFAKSSYYTDANKYVNISNWVWKRRDGAERFSFDSEAEREWADILKDISAKSVQSIHTGKKKTNPLSGTIDLLGKEVTDTFITEKDVFLWGKNYPPESTVKFEYYDGAVRSSYPDFIMKDTFGRIHVFEVKSINQSGSISVDKDEYNAKISELRKCYKQASKITDQIFYIPILDGETWKITAFRNGNECTLTLEEFRGFVNAR